MPVHKIAESKENAATSLIIQQHGLDGIDIILAKGDVDDSEDAIAGALANPAAVLGTYMLRTKGIPSFISYLRKCADKLEAYAHYAEYYTGWESKEHRDYYLAKEYDIQFGKSFINMGMVDFTLFIDDCSTNEEAADRITADWQLEFGSLTSWGITLESGPVGIWKKASDISTAIKFHSWLYERYIGPTFQNLGINEPENK